MDQIFKDTRMDNMITDIIDIFHLEGAELVRISGLTNRAKNISGMNLDYTAVANILKKLHDGGLINWQYIMKCPHCGEISYQLVERNINTPKLCDTCQTIYKLTDGSTLEK